MGLDMFAYVATKAGQQQEYWEQDADANTVTKPREIAYWRKHPNLHGWMESLWKRKLHEANKQEPEDNGWGSTFNGIELELTADDLDELERAVVHGQLPGTTGFFFGDDADEFYRESDLEFIKNARAEMFFGLKVFYNSSW